MVFVAVVVLVVAVVVVQEAVFEVVVVGHPELLADD